MKLCKTSCGISFVFLISMLYFNVWKMGSNMKVINDFESLMDKKQKITYDYIKNERKSIYFTVYILGFAFSLALIIYNNRKGSSKLSKMNMLCIIFAVSFVTNYLFYMLSPKTTYMILHLHNQEQREKWVDVYKTFQTNYHFGFVLGIGALLFLTNGLCQ